MKLKFHASIRPTFRTGVNLRKVFLIQGDDAQKMFSSSFIYLFIVL